MAANTTTRTITVKVDAGGGTEALRKVAKEMGDLSKNTKSLSGNMSFLTNAFRSWIGFLGVRELTQMSDTMQNLNNRLKLITGSSSGAKEAFSEIATIADRTSASISDTGTSFVRFSNALKSTGATSKEIAALTEVLTNSFRLAGTTGGEAAAATIQLSQAFSKGKLDGDEFRTVMETNVILANALKATYGTDIYKKSKEGAIGIKDVITILSKEQENINRQAKELAPTFEQTLVKAMNKVSIQIKDLNEKYELSAKFADVMDFAIRNLADGLTILGGVLVTVAVLRIPAMITALRGMQTALFAFASTNPYIAAFAALVAVGTLIYVNFDRLSDLFKRFRQSVQELAADIVEKLIPARLAIAGLFGDEARRDAFKGSEAYVKALRERAKDIGDLTKTLISAGTDAPKTGGQSSAEDLLKALADRQKSAAEKAKSLKGELAELNKQFLRDGDIAKYNKALIAFELEKVNRQFREGKTDIFKYHEQLRDLEIQELDRQFRTGAISLDKLNNSIGQAKLSTLNEQVKAGKIDLKEYNEELDKIERKYGANAPIYTGISNFIESAGTIAEGVASVTSQAFSTLSDTLTEFIQTGKLQFKEFTDAILKDLTAMLVRAAIVRPIAQGILGLAASFGTSVATGGGSGATGGLSLGAEASPFANGGIMSSRGSMPLNRYAMGGVADSPQIAMFGEGRTPEAYVPLPDGRSIPVTVDGGGGVSVNQTINVYSDGTSDSKESTTGDKAKQLGDLIRRVTLDTIIQQRRAGGVLA